MYTAFILFHVKHAEGKVTVCVVDGTHRNPTDNI